MSAMEMLQAAGSGDIAALTRFLDAGADVAARSNDGRSAVDLLRRKLDWWRRFAPTKNPEHQADLQTILAMLLGQK